MTDITFYWSGLIQGTYTHTHREKRLTVRFIKLVLSTKTKKIQVNSLLIMYHFLCLNRSGGKIIWLNWEGRFAGSRCHTQSYTLMLCSDQVTPGVKDGISRCPAGLQSLHPQYQIYGLSLRRTSIFASPVPQYHTWGFSVMGILISASPVSHLGLLRDGDSNFCIPRITLGVSQ